MKFDPDIHHRCSIRLADFDYSSAGFYFVTICVQGRECLLGEIADGEVVLNEAGRMVEDTWLELSVQYPGIALDEHVVMPNHFHGIIVLQSPAVLSLPDVVHRFKSLTTTRYRYGVNNDNWPPFPGKLWQRNYYERIIRNENELHQIRQYIHDNPAQWESDNENPTQIL